VVVVDPPGVGDTVWVSVCVLDAGGVIVTFGEDDGGLTTVVELGGFDGVVTTSGVSFSTVQPITMTLASEVTKIAFRKCVRFMGIQARRRLIQFL